MRRFECDEFQQLVWHISQAAQSHCCNSVVIVEAVDWKRDSANVVCRGRMLVDAQRDGRERLMSSR